jgi:tellurite resistance protein TerC
METISIGTPALWAGFILFVLAMLALDLFVLGGRTAHRVRPREALAWSLVWVALAFAFAGGLWWHLDATAGRVVADAKALEFITGYLIEKSLSVDNIFVFLMIFTFFAVPPEFQRRVLLYGVLGAIVLRAAMIFAGVWLVSQFHWVLYLFGAFLLITGIKMLIFADHQPDLAKNPVLRWARGHLRVTQEFEGERFTVRRNGVLWFTPMFLVLLLVETSDVIFAVDSIPAIFAITTDPFIVFTSNIFAILGLRALYFLLADMAERFHLLKYGLAVVLIFVGLKMVIADFYKIPIGIALGVVAGVIVLSVIASLVSTRRPAT